jgi:Domain of unknown function (DUF4276)
MAGPRLLVEVEGQTEEEFVKNVLCPHLLDRGYERVDVRILGNARQRDRRGGITNWPSASKDILRHLHEDRGRIVTTVVDYYALPASENGGWPGRRQAASLVDTSSKRAEAVEAALLADIISRTNKAFDSSRFVPFIAMHEFEALLFSDCDRFAATLGEPKLATELSAIRAAFRTPEDINDSSATAPSKRITQLVEHYEKPFHGVMALLEIGLPKVRSECPHFDRWLCRLEERVVSDLSRG